MGFIPPQNSRLPVELDGKMLCRTLLLMRKAGLDADEELEHLAAHARTCEAPSGYDEPFCPCPWCEALRYEYARRRIRDGKVRRFQLFDGQFEVGEQGQYDYDLLSRLLERSDTSWDDASLLEKPFAKGYFIDGLAGETIIAQLVGDVDAPSAEAAQRAFENWARGDVEWLPPE